MARRVARARFIRPAPRTKMWIGAGVTTGTIVGTTPLHFAVYSADVLALRPFTILRTRVLLTMSSDQAAVSEIAAGGYGEIVVTEQASTIGITALPDPVTEPEADWYVYQPWNVRFEFLSSVGFHPAGGRQYTIDSKAMRKVDINQTFAAVVANDVATGALISTEGRQLIQLH